jgi:hypothetical protein
MRLPTAVPSDVTDTAASALAQVKPVLSAAKDRGQELWESDAAYEMRRRALAVADAARGIDPPLSATKRRWPFGLLTFTLGLGAGVAAALAAKRMNAPIEPPSYAGGTGSDFPVRSDGTIDLTSAADTDLGTIEGAGTGSSATSTPATSGTGAGATGSSSPGSSSASDDGPDKGAGTTTGTGSARQPQTARKNG